MRQSDLKDAKEICQLIFELTRGYGEVGISSDGISVKRLGRPTAFYDGNSLVECLRAAKADEPTAPQE